MNFGQALEAQEYRSRPELSKSGAKNFDKSPAYYKYMLLSKHDPPTPNMLLGSALHLAILEPEKWESDIVEIPSYTSKEGKKMREQANACGKICITPEDAENVLNMVQSIEKTPCWEYLRGSEVEVSFFWNDFATDVALKARLDALHPNAIFDIKKTKDASASEFMWQSKKLKYHWQAYLYRDAVQEETGQKLPFFFIAAEAEPPYCVGWYELPEHAYSQAEVELAILLQNYKQCLETDIWPGLIKNNSPTILGNWPNWKKREF